MISYIVFIAFKQTSILSGISECNLFGGKCPMNFFDEITRGLFVSFFFSEADMLEELTFDDFSPDNPALNKNKLENLIS